MWAPVISIVWTVVYMMQRKITSENLDHQTLRNENGESNRFIDQEETPVTMGFTHRPARKNAEAHRALELLEDYHAKLTRPQDKQLRLAIERVIRIFKSRLFQALLADQPSMVDIFIENVRFSRNLRICIEEKAKSGFNFACISSCI
ncbi:uncharacterized protein [Linepithema humile]|uniref:uncharacterized protein isoform X2 n=1 Tax=Linepithema humile TaxID=83485 RepID=UPI00351F645B